jgi:TrmH family RNA methyltransferase
VLDGTDLYHQALESRGLLVMGNEGNGITSAVSARLTHRLLIPSYPAERKTADSLNVAIATAVTCAEFRRRQTF